VPLNGLGRHQARQTAAWLRRRPIERIISSDMMRATATAEHLAGTLGLPVETDPRLRELSFGIFEGKKISDCEKEYPDIVARWHSGDYDFAAPGGETRRELMARTRAMLDVLMGAPEEHIAVFTHGGTLNALHTHIIESAHPSPREHIHRVFRFSNASVSMALHTGKLWRFLVVNSTFHLEDEPRQLLY
jgi:probable phosphoglycerate mutase